MSWVSLALALLQLAANWLEWAREKNAIAQVQEQETIKQALRLLEVTEKGRLLRAKISTLSDEDAGRLWEEMVNLK